MTPENVGSVKLNIVDRAASEREHVGVGKARETGKRKVAAGKRKQAAEVDQRGNEGCDGKEKQDGRWRQKQWVEAGASAIERI